jgi:hypothetical protein
MYIAVADEASVSHVDNTTEASTADPVVGLRGKTCTVIASNTVVANVSFLISCWHFHNADTKVASSLPDARTSKPYSDPSAG